MTRLLSIGEPAPWFNAPALDGNADYVFDTSAGRWSLLLLMGTAAHEATAAAVDMVARHRDLFDDDRACFFGVTTDPGDVAHRRIAQSLPGIRWFLDYDRAVSHRYGATPDGATGSAYRPHWLLLDPQLRVCGRAALDAGDALARQLRALIDSPPEIPAAPVLILPRILSRDLCRQLIAAYDADGGTDSGFMRDEAGMTVEKINRLHKSRADYHLSDETLVAGLKARLASTLRPMIQRAFQFDASRIERMLVACYDARENGHFRAHRDNTTRGTAHRKFAVTINLNTEDYDGGDLVFPEFGPRSYRAPTGGAVVFSCSLLHEARPVTRGRRYAFLPFLYDDAGARVRERNVAFVSGDLRTYRSGLPPEREAAVTTQ